jgi:hypothetical protein
MELDDLCGNLDNTLHYPLAIHPHHDTHHLEDRVSPNCFGGLYILECNITTRDTTCADNCPEICSGREHHLFKQILCSSNIGNLPLAKKFHVVLDRLDESKLTHLLWIADVQTTQVHHEEQVRENKLLAMVNKSCLNFAIICDPIDLDQVLLAYDVGDSLLAKPNPELVCREFALLSDLQTTAIAYHVQSTTCLLDPRHEASVATQVKC